MPFNVGLDVWRGQDLNLRSLDYESSDLPNLSTPRRPCRVRTDDRLIESQVA